MWSVDFFVQNGFYVILDNQFNKDQTAITNTPQWLQRVSCPFSEPLILNLVSGHPRDVMC